MTTERSSSQPDAEMLFDEFLAGLEEGAGEDFEAFVADHGEHAQALRALHARWQALDARLESALPGPVADESFFHGLAGVAPARGPAGALAAAATLDARPGRVLGDYRLVRLLGHGGMGQVWEAEQLSLQRRVALKLMRPGRDGAARAHLLEREARAGGRIAHPSLVAVHAAGEIDGVHFIAQELVGDGFTLADFLARLRGEARLPPEYYRRVARLFAEVADALHAAHEAGILHRDLKPQNILIGPDDRPKVSDFGLAWVADGSSATAQPGLVGTYPYMSPEQAGGRDVDIDRRSDVFGLGAVLYEALTLRRAFEGDSGPRILQRILEEDPPEPRSIRSQVPRELAVIAGKALQKLRSDRYATAAEMAADLRRFLGNEPVLATPESLLSRAVKWTRRHPGKSTALLLGSAALVVILSLLVREFDLRRSAERSAELAEEQSDLATRQAAEALRQSYLANVLAAALQLGSGDHAEARRRLAAAAPERRGWEWHHHALRADLSLLRLPGHAGGVTAVAVAPDGQTLVTGDGEGTLRVWDAATGAERLRLSTRGGAVRSLLAGGAGTVVVGSQDRSLARLADGVLVPLGRHDGEVTAVAVSLDGRRIASGGSDGRVQLWGDDGPSVVVLPGGGGGVVSVALDAAGQRLVTGSRYGTVEIWDAATGELVDDLLAPHRDEVTVAVSDDGGRIFAGSSDGLLRAWDTSSGRPLAQIPAHEFRISALAVDGTGRHIVSASAEDNTIRLWDGERWVATATLTGHDGRVAGLAISRDGLLIVAGGSDSAAVAWDGRTLDAVVELPAPSRLVTALALSRDGRLFATGSLQEGTLRLWDGEVGRVAALLAGHGIGVTAVAVDDAGTRVVSAGYDGTLRVWDGSGNALASFAAPGAGVSSLALDAAGRRLVAGSHDRRVYVLDVRDGAALAVLEGHGGTVSSVAVSADGETIASASDDGMLRLWRGLDGEGLVVRPGGGIDDGLVALSADGRRLARASLRDERIQVWDGEGVPVAVLSGYRNGVTALAMSADGERIVSASARDDTLRVWDASTGDLVAVLDGHTGSVTAVAMSRDGRRIVSAARDGTLRVWESDRQSARRLWQAIAARR